MSRLTRLLVLTLALVALSAATAHATPADAFEYDGTRATAKVITVGDTVRDMKLQNHTISSAGDKDWVKFPAAGGTYYYFTAPARNDIVIDGNIYDAAGRLIKGLPNLQSQRLRWVPPRSGTYYVRFNGRTGATGNTTGWYAAQIAIAPPSARITDPAEPDDTTSTAKPMTTYASTVPYFFANSLARGQWHTMFNEHSDVDTDTCYLDTTQRQVDISQPIGIGVASDGAFKRRCRIDILDVSGTQIESSNFPLLASSTLLPTYHMYVFVPKYAGRHYIRIVANTSTPPAGQPFCYRTYAYPNLGPREF